VAKRTARTHKRLDELARIVGGGAGNLPLEQEMFQDAEGNLPEAPAAEETGGLGGLDDMNEEDDLPPPPPPPPPPPSPLPPHLVEPQVPARQRKLAEMRELRCTQLMTILRLKSNGS
jgi:hypothetical protein